jgi:hypothetical protein
LHSLGYYVLYTANGDEIIAQSSGFAIARSKSPRPAPARPENVRLLDGPNAGELKLRFGRPQGAVSFVYEITEHPLTPDSIWARKTGTQCKTFFTGLQSSKRYVSRVVVVGINGQQAVSDPVSRVAQ